MREIKKDCAGRVCGREDALILRSAEEYRETSRIREHLERRRGWEKGDGIFE
jgi:hypothetical protein